jgi:ABC-type Fe3+/spermidine/putrescine transport system ATPase subunit
MTADRRARGSTCTPARSWHCSDASGSGKSTLLRCVAGLHPLRAGRVAIDGTRCHRHSPSSVADVGLVFQDHALFPHLDVAGNVSLRTTHAGGGRRGGRARTSLQPWTRRPHCTCASRAVDELSGGEQQRVALARALAERATSAAPRRALWQPRPAAARATCSVSCRTWCAALGAAALLVTHDQQDALAVADRVAVLIDGRAAPVRRAEQLSGSVPCRCLRSRAFLDVGPGRVELPGVATGSLGALPAAARTAATLLLPRALARVSSPAPEVD